MKKETSKNKQPCHILSVRCSACVYYDQIGKTIGVCNKHLKSFFHYKTGKLAMSMNIRVRSFWKCDDFLHNDIIKHES